MAIEEMNHAEIMKNAFDRNSRLFRSAGGQICK